MTFAIAAVESGFAFHVDDALPLWDKPVHALCAFGLMLMISPARRLRTAALVAVLGTGIAWEVVQFVVEPFQGQPPLRYAIDTLTDIIADILGTLYALRRSPWLARLALATSADPPSAVPRS